MMRPLIHEAPRGLDNSVAEVEHGKLGGKVARFSCGDSNYHFHLRVSGLIVGPHRGTFSLQNSERLSRN